MIGGLGICGRPLCCSTFLDDFQPVSINMAKDQGLSLNPTKISGTCGRLMCCLKYENDAYQELLRNTPPNESLVDTPQGRGTIIDTSLLKGCCKVRLQNNPDTPVTFRCDECTVLRAGREKGPRQQEPKTEKAPELPSAPVLTDTLVPTEPQVQAESPAAAEDKPRQQQRHRRDRNKKPGGEQKPSVQTQQTASTQPQQKADAPANSENKSGNDAGEQRPRQNRNRHRRRHHNNHGDKATKSE
jgi:hypothetical protein